MTTMSDRLANALKPGTVRPVRTKGQYRSARRARARRNRENRREMNRRRVIGLMKNDIQERLIETSFAEAIFPNGAISEEIE